MSPRQWLLHPCRCCELRVLVAIEMELVTALAPRSGWQRRQLRHLPWRQCCCARTVTGIQVGAGIVSGIDHDIHDVTQRVTRIRD